MSDALRDFWLRAELEEPVFTYDETRGWKEEEFERLVRMGLLRETEQAQHVMCDACPEGHWEEVLWQPSAQTASGQRGYIPCPVEMAVPVDIHRLRQWAVDVGVLARLVAEAMELSGTLTQILTGRLWGLGRRRLSGRFRDVFLAVGAGWDDGTALLAAIARYQRTSPGLVLVPHRLPASEGWQTPAIVLLSLATVAHLDGGRLTVDLGYVEDLLPRDWAVDKVKSVRNVPVPEDATWPELAVEVRTNSLWARIRGVERELPFDQCGFADLRAVDATGDRPLQFLRLFAMHRGRLSLGAVAAGGNQSAVKKQVSLLRQRLRALFAIEGEPIVFEKASGQYRCAFQVSLESEEGYPTPAGASWLDFRIVELADGRLAVGVRTQEKFQARQMGPTANRPSSEVAERHSREWHEYSLDRLGLAGESGLPTPEGRILLDLLRGSGKLRRRGDDMAVLKAGQWLRKWVGLEEEPLQYSAARQVWIAHFECGSDRQPGALT